MQRSFSRNVIEAVSALVLTAAVAVVPVAGAFAGTAASTQPAAVSAAQSGFAKEQAMSLQQLIDRWTPYIKEASRRFGVAEEWIRAVMRMESGGRTLSDDKRSITSRVGAMGLMQVMPDTYRDLQEQYGLGADPHDPHDNIMAGTAYLRWLHGKYGYPKMFAAYNAGPGTLEAEMAGLRKLPGETRAYIRGIASILGVETPAAEASPAQPVKIVATLTRPDGSSIAIDGDSVDSIRASFPNEFVPGVRTVLTMGEREQGVVEDLATVEAALKRSPNVARIS
jgi:soluble lytic murein transglycosylase-like protein